MILHIKKSLYYINTKKLNKKWTIIIFIHTCAKKSIAAYRNLRRLCVFLSALLTFPDF